MHGSGHAALQAFLQHALAAHRPEHETAATICMALSSPLTHCLTADHGRILSV